MFQFTHPVWGATGKRAICMEIETSFNSRTPCGVRRDRRENKNKYTKFQFTHPVWGATESKFIDNVAYKFQFTHPVWGATVI